jgi:hypothetical protein
MNVSKPNVQLSFPTISHIVDLTSSDFVKKQDTPSQIFNTPTIDNAGDKTLLHFSKYDPLKP